MVMLRYFLLWLCAVAFAYAVGCLMGAADAHADACNQKIYDEIYRAIVKESLKSSNDGGKTWNYDRRNNRIRALRDLCNGQKSSYEKRIK